VFLQACGVLWRLNIFSMWYVLVVFYAYVLMSVCMSLYIPGLRRVGVM